MKTVKLLAFGIVLGSQAFAQRHQDSAPKAAATNKEPAAKFEPKLNETLFYTYCMGAMTLVPGLENFYPKVKEMTDYEFKDGKFGRLEFGWRAVSEDPDANVTLGGIGLPYKSIGDVEKAKKVFTEFQQDQKDRAICLKEIFEPGKAPIREWVIFKK